MGSSPLTRGKPLRVREARKHQGLIPAHAGKTSHRGRCAMRGRAHPRSRGENIRPRLVVWENVGSSPLTRGKLVRGGACLSACGLIPAHAGKTPSSLARSVTSRAHPRSRGENATKSSSKPPGPGSSPLTRGKQAYSRNFLSLGGLIPAHAGKTKPSLQSHQALRAHPRSRGENDGGFAWKAGFPGSSPLTRGKRSSMGVNLSVLGLIPAHAGKTLLQRQ